MNKEKKDSDFMKDNRIVHFNGLFEEESAEDAIKDIIELEHEDPSKDIILYIDSYGGNYHSFIAIHDVMRLCRCNIATVCIGKAMSAAQMLLISGTKGKRFITPNATIMMHQISTGFFGNLKEMENEVMLTQRYQKTLEKMIISYTKITKNELSKFMSKEMYFTAEEAVKYGIVDYIIKSPKEFYNKLKI